jgi:uncharacterized protein
VAQNVPLWLKQFSGASTKVTIASSDLPYVKDSILHLYHLGIKNINANVVFENVWQKGDDAIFEAQLIALGDYIIEHQLYKDLYCSLFSPDIGSPIDLRENLNWCGAGRMLAVDHNGDFFPCIRFAAYSLEHKQQRTIGNCFSGLDHNKLRPFLVLNRLTQSPQKCLDCEVARGCAWCQGANYDCAASDTIFERATYICGMHKARVRANNYFWHKYGQVIGC